MRAKLCTTLLAAALALGACGSDDDKKSGSTGESGSKTETTENTASQPGNKYPELIRNNFITACDKQPRAPKSVCECALEKIEEKYSLDEFKRIDAAQREGAKTPKAIEQIVKDCVAEEA